MFPTRQQWNNWTLPSKLTAFGAYVGVSSLVLGVLPNLAFWYSEEEIPFRRLTREHIEYWPADKINQQINSNRLIATLPLHLKGAAEHLPWLNWWEADLVLVGERRGVDSFFVFDDPADGRDAPFKTIICRPPNCGSDWATVGQSYWATVGQDAEYMLLFENYESAIITTVYTGSGQFLDVSAYMWHVDRYIDVMEGAGGFFAHGRFEFLDLDEDGNKELVVTHGCKATDQATQYFVFETRELRYRELDPRHHRYVLFKQKLSTLVEENSVLAERLFSEDCPWW